MLMVIAPLVIGISLSLFVLWGLKSLLEKNKIDCNNSIIKLENKRFEDTQNVFFIMLPMFFLFLFLSLLVHDSIDMNTLEEKYCYYFLVIFTGIYAIIFIYLFIRHCFKKKKNDVKFVEITGDYVNFVYNDSTNLSIGYDDICCIEVSRTAVSTPSIGLVKAFGPAAATIRTNKGVIEWQLKFVFSNGNKDIIINYCPLKYLMNVHYHFEEHIKSTKLYKIHKVRFLK